MVTFTLLRDMPDFTSEVHTKLIGLQSTNELKRKATKARRKHKTGRWGERTRTQEGHDLSSRLSAEMNKYLQSPEGRRETEQRNREVAARKAKKDAMLMEKLKSLDILLDDSRIGEAQEDWEKNAVYSEQGI